MEAIAPQIQVEEPARPQDVDKNHDLTPQAAPKNAQVEQKNNRRREEVSVIKPVAKPGLKLTKSAAMLGRRAISRTVVEMTQRNVNSGNKEYPRHRAILNPIHPKTPAKRR